VHLMFCAFWYFFVHLILFCTSYIILCILILSVLESGRHDDLNLIYKSDKPDYVARWLHSSVL
jgi:hypothetical protein